ncbi:MAG: hypothetical protein K6C97_06115 [Treponema sp.]|nr:hypothetical protein [Treponema sp.]
MLSKSRIIGTFAALFIIMGICGCASKQADTERPLWASNETIESVYPNATYIARIGYAASAEAAGSMAEAELASYFSHTVHSQVEATQVMVDSKKSGQESNASDSKVSRKIEKTVNVDSMQELFDVHKTQAWFDRQNKRYVSCAYIKRADGFKLYEGTVSQAKNIFRSYYDKAAAEKDPLEKLELLSACKESGEDYLDTLQVSRLLYPTKESAFAGDRKLAEGLDQEMAACRKNCRMYVKASNKDGEKLKACVTKIVKDQGFYVGENSSDAPYELLIDLDAGRNIFGETLTCQPELRVSLKLVGSSSGDKLNYQKNLAKQSGFTAAQALVDRKILASAEEELNSSLAEELKKLWGN